MVDAMYQSKIISGKELSSQILDAISEDVEDLQINQLRLPCLAVVLVGNDPASQVYVKNKKNACQKVGIKSLEFVLPESTTQEELSTLIKDLNADFMVDGILVQLPLPAHLDSKLVIDTILPNKDVDGFHRYTIMKTHKDIFERENGKLPVVVIDKDESNRMASTIRHNRARGSHSIELMSNIVSELVKAGMSDSWILKNIGMDADELLRLKQVSGLAELFKNNQFSNSIDNG